MPGKHSGLIILLKGTHKVQCCGAGINIQHFAVTHRFIANNGKHKPMRAKVIGVVFGII